MARLLPCYLHTLRKQWGLSQPELAHLLGISTSALCKVETLARRPSAQFLLGAEIVFGHAACETFPGIYGAAEREIVARARALHDALAHDGAARQKLRLLAEIIERAETRD